MYSVAASVGSHMVGMRRTGETEGVRHVGNIRQSSSAKDLALIRSRIVVKDMDQCVLKYGLFYLPMKNKHFICTTLKKFMLQVWNV